jgi:acyl-coenzyme A synthetase/AMP-(fatty) acid ligase/acyl carrier protein
VSDPGVTWSGDQVGARVRRIVAELHAAGLGRRDLVAVVGERGAALVVALVAVIESGAAFCIQDTALPEAWQERQLAIARPAAVLTVRGGDSGRPAVELRQDLAGQPGTGDCDYLQFTTGTSAAPRAVRGGYPQLAAALAAYRELASLDRRDRLALLAGLGHDPMLRDVLAPLAAGAEVVVPPPGYLRSPRELRTWLSVQRITVAHLTPSLLRALGAVDGAALTNLRLLVCAGDALRASDIAAAHRLAPHAELANGYGATETPQLPAFARVDPNAPPVRGTIAVRDGVAGSRLLVERSSGEDAAVGEVGEIVVESPALALGYGGDVDSSIAARFGPGACPRCRRYATADRGRRLADGSVEILGRGGDEVSIASHRVSLGAVDALLREEFALLDAITLVLDEDGAASRLASWLVPQTGTRLDAVTVRRRLRRIAPPEYLPSVVTVVGEIPRDPRGKPDRRALTDALPLPAAGHGGASPRLEAAHRIEDVVADAYREVLGVHPVPRDANFFDLGGNSLAMTRVLVRLEAELSRPLSTLTLFEFPSVAALAAALADPRTGMPATGAVTVIPVTDDADHRSAVRRAIRQGGLT